MGSPTSWPRLAKLHRAPSSGQFPVTEDLSARLARLPCFYARRDEEQDRVLERARAFLERG